MTSAPPVDAAALLRSKSYVALLVLSLIIGVPISAAAYFFLALVAKLQQWVFTSLPKGLGFNGEPVWWPVLPLLLAGALVGLTIQRLPGRGGRSPADGFKAGEGPPSAVELPGIVIAAVATLSLGVVLGPEAPLIALGSGLGALAIRLVRRDAPARTQSVVAAAGSFAAISAVLGSPLTGAFLLMEASGLGGAMMELVLIPGLLAAGVGFAAVRRPRTVGPGSARSRWRFPTCLTSGHRLSPSSCGRSPSGCSRTGVAALSDGSAGFCGRTSSGGCCCSPRLVGLAIAGLAVAYDAADRQELGRRAVLRAVRPRSAHRRSSGTYASGRWCCSIVCKGLAYSVVARAASVAALPSRPCSSARRAGSPCRTCPASRSSPASRWASVR